MKAEALTQSTIELPEARIIVESNGQALPATGFIVRTDERGKPIVVIKAGKNSAS